MFNIKIIKFALCSIISWFVTVLIVYLFNLANLPYVLGITIGLFLGIGLNYLFAISLVFTIKNTDSPDYEWWAFFNGNPIQKWWKQSIAKIVWDNIPSESYVLNVGCGSSPLACKYPNGTNIDNNEKKLEFLKRKIPAASFIATDVTNLSQFKNEQFDSVMCVEVIEHVNLPEKLMQEMSRVLKVNGKLVVATPDYAKPMWHLVELFTPYKELHGSKLTKSAIDSMARSNHLRVSDSKYVAGCDLISTFIKAES